MSPLPLVADMVAHLLQAGSQELSWVSSRSRAQACVPCLLVSTATAIASCFQADILTLSGSLLGCKPKEWELINSQLYSPPLG